VPKFQMYSCNTKIMQFYLCNHETISFVSVIPLFLTGHLLYIKGDGQEFDSLE
jgi:hypothetical protein